MSCSLFPSAPQFLLNAFVFIEHSTCVLTMLCFRETSSLHAEQIHVVSLQKQLDTPEGNRRLSVLEKQTQGLCYMTASSFLYPRSYAPCVFVEVPIDQVHVAWIRTFRLLRTLRTVRKAHNQFRDFVD